MMRFVALLAALFALLCGPSLAAQDFPARPTGPVLDAANVLPPQQEAALVQRLTEYNRQTGRAIVVATVPSLGGETIERYAVELYERWGIGGAETDMGALLLVAPQDRKVRIEVGYGLTPYLTDVMTGRIIRNQIVPRFRENDLAGGIVAGLDGMIETLALDPVEAKAIAEAEAAAAQNGGSGANVGTIGGAIFWVVMIFGFMLLFGRGGRRRRHRRYGAAGAVGDVLLWSALGHAMGSGSRDSGFGGFGGGGGGGFGGGGFGGFGGGMSGGGGASGSW